MGELAELQAENARLYKLLADSQRTTRRLEEELERANSELTELRTECSRLLEKRPEGDLELLRCELYHQKRAVDILVASKARQELQSPIKNYPNPQKKEEREIIRQLANEVESWRTFCHRVYSVTSDVLQRHPDIPEDAISMQRVTMTLVRKTAKVASSHLPKARKADDFVESAQYDHRARLEALACTIRGDRRRNLSLASAI